MPCRDVPCSRCIAVALVFVGVCWLSGSCALMVQGWALLGQVGSCGAMRACTVSEA